MKTKEKLHAIYTVVITEGLAYERGDLSTVSFCKFDDAIDYCLKEIGINDDEVRDELRENMFYKDEDNMIYYYIEEATLVD